MKMKKIVASLLILVIMISLLPTQIFAVSTVNFTITPNVTEAHPGDEITYTVKMSAVQNLGGIQFKLVIPEGLTFIEGKEVDGLDDQLNAVLAKFTESTKVFAVGSCDYSSDTETVLMTFKCSVDDGTTGDKEITFSTDDCEVIDTTIIPEAQPIPFDCSNPGSKVTITIPSTGISLNKTTLSLERGTNETLVATVTPENSTDAITWESSDKTKATVDTNGNVTAVAEGTAVITAKTTSGKTATCTVTITKPVCKHTSLSTVEAKEAKCTTAGNNEYKKCDNCDKVFKIDGITETTIEAETIKPLGHDYTVPKSDENQHWNACSRCDLPDTKINHVGEGEYVFNSEKHWKVCGCGTLVGEENHKESEPVKENEVKPSCTLDGSHDEVIYCTVCKFEMSRENKTDKALGHTEGTPTKENIVPATCTEDGNHDEVVYCTVCDEELSRENKTDKATGHTNGAPVKEDIIPATCTKKGSYNEVIYCTVCSKEISRTPKETAMIPHDGSASDWCSDENDHWKECGCGTRVDVENHKAADAVKEHIVPATCTKDGSHDEVVYCSVCNRELSRENKTDKALGHTEGTPTKENVVPATCTKDGNHDEVIKCTVCSEELSRENKTDKALGHTEGTPVKENHVKPTCTKDGSYEEVVYCETCNDELSRTDKTDKATGHTEGTPIKENEVEATTEKEGSYELVTYCIDCEEELKREKKTTPKFVYEIVTGDSSSYEKNGKNGITIQTNGKVDKFESIKVDGNVVSESNYLVDSSTGSVTLKPDYLNTLSIGEHKISLVYEDGEIDTTIKVTEDVKKGQENDKKEPTSPKTDDISNVGLWKVGMAISGILFVIIIGWKIKGSKRKGRH